MLSTRDQYPVLATCPVLASRGERQSERGERDALLDEGERRLFLDPGCNELRKDLQQVVWKADVAGNITGDIDKSDKRRTHVSDALGYLAEEEFGLKGFAGFRQDRIF